MGRRQQKRLGIALPVTVSGLDTYGNPFTQSATTVDISPCGVRLRGVRCLRQRSDFVELHYKHRRAHYRVAWIGEPGGCDADVVGLEGLEDARFLFAEHLTATTSPMIKPEADAYCVDPPASPIVADIAAVERRQQEPRQEERRRHPRFNCVGTAHIWENGLEDDISARINEISLGGCYIEMMAPMRVGTGIRLELAISGSTIHLEGLVRTSQANCGMGIEFTHIAATEGDKLHRLIAELSGEFPDGAQPQTTQDVPCIKHRGRERARRGDSALVRLARYARSRGFSSPRRTTETHSSRFGSLVLKVRLAGRRLLSAAVYTFLA